MKTETVTLSLRVYLVIYVDLLGQSVEIEQVRRMPKTVSELEAARTAINRSAGSVRRLRYRFQSVISELVSAYSELEAKIPPEGRKALRRLQPKVNQLGFSDSFVVSIPLQEEPDELEGAARAASAVFNVLVALAGISLLALSEGVPLRGGLQVGPAVELFPGEAYGAPLMDAYKLESTVADYPRTAVHPDLYGYLQYLEQLPAETQYNVYAAKKATECRRLICEAPDDGQPMLHLLSPDVTRAEPEFAQFRRPAYDWVRSQVERYRGEPNFKLAGRYSRLARYFDTYM